MDSTTDSQYDAAIAYAKQQGTKDGLAAASWYFDGNTTHDAYVNVLGGIVDGDSKVLDTFPQPDLSGEWADTLTGPELVADAWEAAGFPKSEQDGFEDATDICDAYEAAFSQAVQDDIERAARYQLVGDPLDAPA